MISRALLLAAATAALVAPVKGQAVFRVDTPMLGVDAPSLDLSPAIATRSFPAPHRVVVAPAAPTVPAADLSIRSPEELRTYRRQRTLGGGVLVAGAAALVAALFDWADGDAFGMSSGATAAFMGGTGLIFLGAEFRRVATQRIAQAEARRDGTAETGDGNR